MPSDATSMRARIIDDVCGRIISGESVSQCFASKGEGYPDEATFWRWLAADETLDAQYERATIRRAEIQAQEVVNISDEAPQMVSTQFGEHVDLGWVAWNRNRTEARKWVAARMRPKRWGDKQILSNDPDNPIPPMLVVGVATIPDGNKSDPSD